ncbi:MAG: hypothetical protein ACI89T_002342 [Cognaticolwellia sp.]|jgi:hypothetical protein
MVKIMVCASLLFYLLLSLQVNYRVRRFIVNTAEWGSHLQPESLDE